MVHLLTSQIFHINLKPIISLQNTHHLSEPEIEKHFAIEIPTVSIVEYLKCLITPTNHLFETGKYRETGLIKSHDNRKINTWKKSYLLVKSRFFNKRITITGGAIWGHDEWSNNYYHWFCEALPRIFLMHQRQPLLPVVIPDTLVNITFVEASLNILQIPLLIYNDKNTLIVDKVITTETTPKWSLIQPTLQKELVNEIKNKLSLKSLECNPRKIYLTRRNARYRRIINETEVIDLLQKHHYEIIQAETLSLKEQIELFNASKKLIALHGAGQTNLMFMQQNSKILEIRNPSMSSQPLCYFDLSNIFNVTWNYITADPVGEIDNFNDVSVNIPMFTEQLLAFEND